MFKILSTLSSFYQSFTYYSSISIILFYFLYTKLIRKYSTKTIIDKEYEEYYVKSFKKEPSVGFFSILSNGFLQDPLMKVIVQNVEKRRYFIYSLFRIMGHDDNANTYYIASKSSDVIVGSLIWFDSKFYWSPLTEIKSVIVYIKSMGLLDYVNFIKDVSVLDQSVKDIMREHESSGYYYIHSVSVDWSYRGKGIGSKLLTNLLELADREKKWVYVESVNPRNVNFFVKNGFVVEKKIELFDGFVKASLLRREPK